MASSPVLPTEDEQVSLGIDDLHFSLQGIKIGCGNCGNLTLIYSQIVLLSVSLMVKYIHVSVFFQL